MALHQPLADKYQKFTVIESGKEKGAIESGKEKGAIPIVKKGVSSVKQGLYPHLFEERGEASVLLVLITI